MLLNLLLIMIGLAASVHLMCTAAILSPKAPLTLITEVVCGFGAAVGATIASIHNDQQRALMFFAVVTLCLVLFSFEKGVRNQSYLIKIAQKMNRRKTDRVRQL
jgi:uncharacterized membrane protein